MTAIATLYAPLRFLLGDRDPSFPEYEDAHLLAGVRAAVAMGKLPGYALSVDQNSITPTVSDPNQLALLLYWVVRLATAPVHSSYSYRTRALSESFGSQRALMEELEIQIHALENGTMFGGWQMFAAWWEGHRGVPFWEQNTQVKVQAPFETIHYGPDGSTTSDPEAAKEINMMFTQVGAAITGNVLLGEYVPARVLDLTRLILNCAAGTAEVTLAITVNGVDRHTFTVTAGAVRVDQVPDPILTVVGTDLVRVRVVSAPAAEASISSISVNLFWTARS